jgi:hypothetical protein
MQADDIASGIADAVSHPLTVQVINQGPGIWGNVATGLITGVLTGGVALTGIWLTHRFTLKREKLVSEDKLRRERHFIATELVFLLEEFAEGCLRVANDPGNILSEAKHETLTPPPILDLNGVSGDWRALPQELIYGIRQLAVLQFAADRNISDVGEYALPHLPDHYIHERQYHYSKLGLKGLIMAKRLRKEISLPDASLSGGKYAPFPALWAVWRRCRKIRMPNRW